MSVEEKVTISMKDYIDDKFDALNGKVDGKTLLQDAVLNERISGLEKLVEARFEERNRAIDAAFSAADKAVMKAETAIEKRFENTNEWRAALEQHQDTYLPRVEFERAHENLVERVDSIGEVQIKLLPREEYNVSHKGITDKVDMALRMLWIGFGIIITIQFLIGIAVYLHPWHPST